MFNGATCGDGVFNGRARNRQRNRRTGIEIGDEPIVWNLLDSAFGEAEKESLRTGRARVIKPAAGDRSKRRQNRLAVNGDGYFRRFCRRGGFVGDGERALSVLYALQKEHESSVDSGSVEYLDPELTAQIDSDNPAVKIPMQEGHQYRVRFNIRTATYEKDGKKNSFVSVTIHQLYLMV